MRYCADTWFVLELFGKNPHATAILHDVKNGKTRMVIPLTVFAETYKKLMQSGIPISLIEDFFAAVHSSEKIELIYPDKMIAKEAARLSLSYSIPLLDSFVAATAKLTQCDTILSGDSDFGLLKRYIKIQKW